MASIISRYLSSRVDQAVYKAAALFDTQALAPAKKTQNWELGLVGNTTNGYTVTLGDGTTWNAVVIGDIVYDVAPCLKISADTYLIKGESRPPEVLGVVPAKGFIARYDGTYAYIHKIGEKIKYYLPNVFSGADYTKFQVLFSSNAKAVFVGAVIQDPATKRQVANWVAYFDFKLVTDSTFSPPTHKFTYKSSKTGTFDLNTTFINGKVAPPLMSETGSSNLWLDQDGFGDYHLFDPLWKEHFDGDTGPLTIFVGSVPGGCWNTFENMRNDTNGDHVIGWQAVPNVGLVNNFVFTFNNDTSKPAKYEADLLVSFNNVSVYSVGQEDTTEFWNWQYARTGQFGSGPLAFASQIYNYSRFYHQTYTYTYPDSWPYDFIFDPLSTAGKLSYDWNSGSTSLQGSNCQGLPHDGYTGNSTLHYNDGIFANLTTTNSGAVNGYADAIFEAFNDNFLQPEFTPPGGNTYVTYFNGLQVPGLGIPLAFNSEILLPPTGQSIFSDMSVNAFTLFFASIHRINWGRSVLALKSLLSNTPQQISIAVSVMNTGTDKNILNKGFRGRSFQNDSNTAYTYGHTSTVLDSTPTFGLRYFYSSPYNASGILQNQNPPDVFSDKIFSAQGTFPFQQPGQILKAVDSFSVEGYYVTGNRETIQLYTVKSDGLTKKGKKASKSGTFPFDPMYDFITAL